MVSFFIAPLSRPARREPTAQSPAGRPVAVFASARAKLSPRSIAAQRLVGIGAVDEVTTAVAVTGCRSSAINRRRRRERRQRRARHTTTDDANHKHACTRASPLPIANARRNRRAHPHVDPTIYLSSGSAARTRSAGSCAPSTRAPRASTDNARECAARVRTSARACPPARDRRRSRDVPVISRNT